MIIFFCDYRMYDVIARNVCSVIGGDFSSVLIPSIQIFQLDSKQRCLQSIQSGIIANDIIKIF